MTMAESSITAPVVAVTAPPGETNAGFSGSQEDISASGTVSPSRSRRDSVAFDIPDVKAVDDHEQAGRIVIHIENAHKTYGTGNGGRHVLKGLCMSVQQHTIYGLLGASGCGKTTLLSCIVALRKLDSGSILVCGEPTGTPKSGIPGRRVGYMPQEIALNGECNIQEVLLYFGRIYGMARSQIDKRHDYLVNLLSLQGLHQPVENLSEGQKRRVSMAVALLHEPEILILDEPTVGCDPLLRDSIWKYLHKLVEQKKATVIVTTHYIEEMRQAHQIGIMRSGHLLCEDTPPQLLSIFNEELLDTVVVKLCQRDEKAEAEKLRDNARATSPNGDVALDEMYARQALALNASRRSTSAEVKVVWRKNKKHKSTTSFFHRMHALTVKNLLVILRNVWFTIILICLPASTVMFFCVAVGSDPSGLKIGVVNEETSFCLTNYTSRLADGGGGGGCLQPVDLSCEYLLALNRDIVDLIPFETKEDALAEIRRAKLWGFMTFGPEFSKNFYTRVVEGDTSGNETIGGSQIDVRLDMTGATNGLILQKLFIDAFRKLTGLLLISCGIDAAGKDLPVAFGEPVYGEVDAELTEYMGPGVALGFTFFMCALQCGLTFILEKKDGMLNRTTVAGVGKVEIMLSHFLVQLFVVALIQIVIAILTIYVVFAIPLRGSFFLCFILLVINSMTGMSLGFLLATFCSDEKFAMLMAMGFVFPNFLLAGLLWPIESLPRILQTVSLILPCTLTGEAIRSISLRGYDLSHPNVYNGFASSLIWISVYWLIIVLWHRFGQRKQ